MKETTMKSFSRPQTLLATLGLACLLVYVLACASFSPDDTKVAFPAFQPKTGEMGISVLDRKSGRIQPVFSLSVIKAGEEPDYEARILRAQWSDNHHILVTWPGTRNEDNGLNVLLVPYGTQDSTRHWQLAKPDEMAEKMARPLALAGSSLLLPGESNRITRLDLETGRVTSRPVRGEDLVLYPSGQAEAVFYVASLPGAANQMECGTLDSLTLAQHPWLTLNEADLKGVQLNSEKALFAFDPRGQQLAFFSSDTPPALLVARSGSPLRSIPLIFANDQVELGGLCFSGKGDRVFAAYLSPDPTTNNATCGLLEIPLDASPLSRTPLFQRPGRSDKGDILYLQPELSHDGKTVALCNTYFYANPRASDTNSAVLFLVDVSRHPARVSRFPLPLPSSDHPFK